MTEAAIFPQTPTVQLAGGGDGGAVRAAAGDVSDALGLQRLDQPRFVTVPEEGNADFSLTASSGGDPRSAGKRNLHPAEVAQLAVVSLPPGEHLPVHGQGHGVASPGVHGHLLHHVVAERGDLAGDGDGPAGEAQAQPAVGGLPARVNLPLHRHWATTTQRSNTQNDSE